LIGDTISDLNKNELDILRYWEDHNIRGKISEKNKNGKAFYFLDGPPYATGELHPGQLWVKAVKDIFLRYRKMRGFKVHDNAGYDVHGLPVEHKVESSLKLESKKDIEEKIGVENFIKYCKEYVDSLIPKMTADYKRFGISMDFDSPYIPYKNEYIENAWKMLKIAKNKKLLYPDLKPMLYCPHCETVLAQGTLEVEYADETDPSIFVAMPVNVQLSNSKINIEGDTHLLIWTTTPWTIPSNMAVAANPKELYVKAKIGKMRLILAKNRLDAVAEMLKESAIIESEFYGSELSGVYYIHPLEDEIPEQKKFRKYHKIILDEGFVSTVEGSGLVHIAPGHGIDDFNAGRKNKIKIFCPLDQHAKYTEEAGKYAGVSVPVQANEIMVNELKNKGVLLDKKAYRHSYPHCWRCNGKLIFVATKQWFLKIEKVKDKLVKENRKVVWHPSEAQAWQEEVLMNSPDWCISRQRYWGIPLPIWVCDKCKNAMVVGSREELESMAHDKHAAKSITDMHRPQIDKIVLKCDQCGSDSRRVPDVFDVWFDSGVAFMASLNEDQFEELYPADYILEGKDQLRGWFSTLMKSSVMVYGKRPFNNVIIDGMLIGEDGREMHKHLGNYISVSELLKLTSADAFRLWCSNHTQWLDLQFNSEEIKEAEKAITILYNMFNLMNEYALAINYNKQNVKNPGKNLDIEDEWIISRLNTTINKVTDSLENYNVQKANTLLNNFSVNDFSRFYLKLAKKRVMYSAEKIARRKIDVMNYVLYHLVLLYAPFIPFASEYLYLNNYKSKESIFLENWPKFNNSKMNGTLEGDMDTAIEAITAILSNREKAGIKLRWPVKEVVMEVNSDSTLDTMERFSTLIEDYANSRKLTLKRVDAFSKSIVPAFQKIGPEFKENGQAVAKALRESNADELLKEIGSKGHYQLHTDKGPFNITNEHFTIVEKARNENAVAFRNGVAYVNPEIDNELRDEAMIREFERRVQLLRKRVGLKKVDRIDIFYEVPVELEKLIISNRDSIAKHLSARQMARGVDGKETVEFDIEGEKIKLSINKY
jgi:isoleucyl-tRNA synthetase